MREIKDEIDLGCFGCLLMAALFFAGIGLIGLAWKFAYWAWH